MALPGPVGDGEAGVLAPHGVDDRTTLESGRAMVAYVAAVPHAFVHEGGLVNHEHVEGKAANLPGRRCHG